jgi:hypothetical protein
MHIQRSEDDWADHFVVVKRVGKTRIELWDPDPLEKKKRVPYDDFFKYWTGFALFLEPDECFRTGAKKENLLLKFIPVFLPHKKLLVYSFLASVMLMVFGIVSSFYCKYVFDEVIFAKASFSLATLSIGILAVTVVQSVVGTIRSILLSHFSYKTDLQLNFSYIAHIFRLPLSFFESRKSGRNPFTSRRPGKHQADAFGGGAFGSHGSRYAHCERSHPLEYQQHSVFNLNYYSSSGKRCRRIFFEDIPPVLQQSYVRECRRPVISV